MPFQNILGVIRKSNFRISTYNPSAQFFIRIWAKIEKSQILGRLLQKIEYGITMISQFVTFIEQW